MLIWKRAGRIGSFSPGSILSVISVFPIKLPALRERPEVHSPFGDSLPRALQTEDWPIHVPVISKDALQALITNDGQAMCVNLKTQIERAVIIASGRTD
jgi:DNA-binding NtrC family response regulator